jgi:NADPH:quinone reductase-like Zn-dependent oxidoreductase
MMESSMKAMVYHKYGSPDVLALEEIEKPVAQDDQVLIQVRAAAVTPFDWHMLTGTPYIARIIAGLLGPKNKVLGIDMAGWVEAVGADVKGFKPGDEVIAANPKLGGFAEYVCAPEAHVVPKPEGMSFEEAAAIPLGAVTALICLCELGRIKPGQRVLINGASGGVGTLAVQIAKSVGAKVTGVCSTRNLELVRSLGADAVIDYTQEDFTQSETQYDLIFDAVAKRSFSDCRRALSPQGIYVTTEFSPTLVLQAKWASMIGSQRLVPMVPSPSGPSKNTMDRYKEFLKAGTLKPVIERSYPLSELPEAFRYYAQGHPRGRVIITLK